MQKLGIQYKSHPFFVGDPPDAIHLFIILNKEMDRIGRGKGEGVVLFTFKGKEEARVGRISFRRGLEL